jgi:hypothetical protein
MGYQHSSREEYQGKGGLKWPCLAGLLSGLKAELKLYLSVKERVN